MCNIVCAVIICVFKVCSAIFKVLFNAGACVNAIKSAYFKVIGTVGGGAVVMCYNTLANAFVVDLGSVAFSVYDISVGAAGFPISVGNFFIDDGFSVNGVNVAPIIVETFVCSSDNVSVFIDIYRNSAGNGNFVYGYFCVAFFGSNGSLVIIIRIIGFKISGGFRFFGFAGTGKIFGRLLWCSCQMN